MRNRFSSTITWIVHVIGIDIGATNLLVGVIEQEEVAQRTHQRIESTSFEDVVVQVCALVNDTVDALPESVGIAVAGSVNATSGVVLRAQNLNWDNVPLAKAVEAQLGCNVVIENDVTASAWGEFQFGAGRGAESLFAVWIGTGIGGGLILENKIWRGPLGTGGEFGMSISEFDPSSNERYLEEFASRSGIQKLIDGSLTTSKIFADGFNTETELGTLLELGAQRIGTSIANVVTLLSLDTVVIGGGVTEALGQPFVDSIRANFDADVFP